MSSSTRPALLHGRRLWVLLAGFWTALSILSAIRGHVLFDVPWGSALVNGFWFMYSNAALFIAGILLVRGLELKRVSLWLRLCLLVSGSLVVLLVQDAAWLGGSFLLGQAAPQPNSWIARYHVKLALLAYSIVAALAVSFLQRRRQQEMEIAALSGEMTRVSEQTFRTAVDPAEIIQRLQTVRGLLQRDPTEANALLTELADHLRIRLELLDRPRA